MPFNTLKLQYEPSVLKWPARDGSAILANSQGVTVFKSAVPRDGCVLLIGVRDMQAIMSFTTKTCADSKWATWRHKAWENMLLRYGLDGNHLVKPHGKTVTTHEVSSATASLRTFRSR